MAAQTVTTETLDSIMDLGHPVEVHPDGTVTDAGNDVYTPELTLEVDEDGQAYDNADEDLKRQAASAGWELLAGFSGQHGYRGPVFHSSEYIGGRLASEILENSGVYVAVAVETLSPNEDEESEPAGWALAKKIS